MFAYTSTGSSTETTSHEGRQILAFLGLPTLRDKLCRVIKVFLIKVIANQEDSNPSTLFYL